MSYLFELGVVVFNGKLGIAGQRPKSGDLRLDGGFVYRDSGLAEAFGVLEVVAQLVDALARRLRARMHAVRGRIDAQRDGVSQAVCAKLGRLLHPPYGALQRLVLEGLPHVVEDREGPLGVAAVEVEHLLEQGRLILRRVTSLIPGKIDCGEPISVLAKGEFPCLLPPRPRVYSGETYCQSCSKSGVLLSRVRLQGHEEHLTRMVLGECRTQYHTLLGITDPLLPLVLSDASQEERPLVQELRQPGRIIHELAERASRVQQTKFCLEPIEVAGVLVAEHEEAFKLTRRALVTLPVAVKYVIHSGRLAEGLQVGRLEGLPVHVALGDVLQEVLVADTPVKV